MELLGKTILIVNSYETACDLFEKRSANYSDRNELPMINDLCVSCLWSILCPDATTV